MSVDDEAFDSDSFVGEDGDFVTVFFARDQEEAEEYCELLADHDIPTRAGPEGAPPDDRDGEHQLAGRRGMTHGVPVLVPESLLDEASEVIADREDFDDFDEEEDEDEEDEDEGFGLEEVDDEEDDALFDDDDDDDLEDDDEEEDKDDDKDDDEEDDEVL